MSICVAQICELAAYEPFRRFDAARASSAAPGSTPAHLCGNAPAAANRAMSAKTGWNGRRVAALQSIDAPTSAVPGAKPLTTRRIFAAAHRRMYSLNSRASSAAGAAADAAAGRRPLSQNE